MGPLLGGAFLAQLVAEALGVQFSFTIREPVAEGAGLFQARYRLPGALARRLAGKRCAIVDDVMSAGSSLRATYFELQAHGAVPVVVGALLVLGSIGREFFDQRYLPVESVAYQDYQFWPPETCPLCAAGVPVTIS